LKVPVSCYFLRGRRQRRTGEYVIRVNETGEARGMLGEDDKYLQNFEAEA
jgi:hypothetical protein